MREHHQPAFVLLNRPYSESSFITEFFTRDYGRIALIAKGARRIKSPFRGALLPFTPLLISWSGKGDVPTLTGAELDRTALEVVDAELSGDALICGFYCNELITYLLHRYDPHPKLFDRYAEALQRLHRCEQSGLPRELREFERIIMRETGYEVNFELESDHKTAIVAQQTYLYDELAGGFRTCSQQHPRAIMGSVLLGLADESREPLNAKQLSRGKQVMRDILSHSLGHKKIHSRALFVRSLNTGSARDSTQNHGS